MIFDIINEEPGFMSSNAMDEIEKPGIYSFIKGDYKQNFVDRLKDKPEDWYYRTNKVEYTINSHKFRTKEFKDIDWKNSIVLTGCSFTFGLGVTDDHTIAAYLEKITGKYVVNLGQVGASNAAVAYNSYYLKENYPTPLALVNIWTSMGRWFWMHYRDLKKHLLFELLEYTHFRDPTIQKYVDSHSYVPPYGVVNRDKVITEVTNNAIYMKMSNALWKDHPNHLQLARYDYHIDNQPVSMAVKMFPEAIQIKESWANDEGSRDCGHWGRETNEKIAKLIARNLKL